MHRLTTRNFELLHRTACEALRQPAPCAWKSQLLSKAKADPRSHIQYPTPPHILSTSSLKLDAAALVLRQGQLFVDCWLEDSCKAASDPEPPTHKPWPPPSVQRLNLAYGLRDVSGTIGRECVKRVRAYSRYPPLPPPPNPKTNKNLNPKPPNPKPLNPKPSTEGGGGGEGRGGRKSRALQGFLTSALLEKTALNFRVTLVCELPTAA